MMQSSNPALKTSVLDRARAASGVEPMTLVGAISKTAILLVALMIAAAYTWWQLGVRAGLSLPGLMMLGVLGGFVVALVTIFAPRWSPYTAPVYAVLEGLALGSLSWVLEAEYPGLVVNAVLLTFGVLAAMLFLYYTGIVKVTARFTAVIGSALLGICLFYVLSLVLGLFGISMPLLHDSGPLGITLSLVITGVAAFSLMLDFKQIVQGAREGAPKFFEWYFAFGLLVGLVWLYIEIISLLRKLRE